MDCGFFRACFRLFVACPAFRFLFSFTPVFYKFTPRFTPGRKAGFTRWIAKLKATGKLKTFARPVMQPMSRLVPGGTEQIGLPVPKVGSACKRLWPPGCQYARATGLCPGRTCLAACGAGGRGAKDGNWYRQAVRPQRSSGRCSPSDAQACILWIVQPQTARNLFGRAVATEAAHRPGRSDRSGSCGGHGAAVSRPGTKPDLAGSGAALALILSVCIVLRQKAPLPARPRWRWPRVPCP